MGEINVLDSTIFNRIAAGEVVESPKSVIKELVENSIDAEANAITIEIKNGGIDLIRVTDNGKGLHNEDLTAAFLPHATSKVKCLDDLNHISTLGFRGEALPSIAAVAKITMTSRRPTDFLGRSVIFNNGICTKNEDVGASIGTTVLVENLFQQIPARQKFLRKPSLEEADITELISKIILSKPNLSIKYIADGKIIYQSSGGGLELAIYTVYGDILNNLVQINSSMPDIFITGYINKPAFTRHNRTFQTLIVNGRYVMNSEISFCVQQCYQDFLMKRQFPMYILNISMPLNLVDVNVHPNKMNVKFVNFKRIKGIIYNSLRDLILKEAEYPKNIEILNRCNVEVFNQSETAAAIDSLITEENNSKGENDSKIFPKTNFKMSGFHYFDSGVLKEPRNPIEHKKMSAIDSLERNNKTETNIDTTTEFSTKIIDATSFLKPPSCNIAGKLFNTYIMVQENDNVYLIDQHAAHEKILYDKLVKALDSAQICIQDLLLPYIFEVSHLEKVLIDEIITDINQLGFCIQPLSGLSYSLSGVPACCSEINMQEFVSIFIKNIRAKNFKKSVFLKESLMQSACKAAVKGEMDLSANEIALLIQEMKTEKCTLFCPHGRPTVVLLSRDEIEKWFKRIVS